METKKVDISHVPAHVPRDLIRDHDIWATGQHEDPFLAMDRYRDGPPIFYTPVHYAGNAGAWVLTRAEDIRMVMGDPTNFGSKAKSGFTTLIGETWDLIPLELDPPEHRQFRVLLDPLFSPPKMNKMREGLRQSCVDLMQSFVERGECEFVTEFARPYPVKIFLNMMGLPMQDLALFLGWVDLLLRSPDLPGRVKGGRAIRDYLLELIDERRRNPTDDVTSYVVHAKIDEKPLTPDQLIGVLYLFFLAGVDTTTSTLGFCFKYMAEHPEQQQRLRDNPELIPAATEELLRVYSVVVASRHVLNDITVGDVQMKKGDWIVIGTMFGSRDPLESAEPAVIDFDRSINRHIAFSTGVHRCMGSHLARIEIAITLEEWTKRIPNFRVKPDTQPLLHGGIVFGVDEMHLVWDR